MDVSLDQTGASEAPTSLIGLRRISQSALDRHDPALGDADIQRSG